MTMLPSSNPDTMRCTKMKLSIKQKLPEETQTLNECSKSIRDISRRETTSKTDKTNFTLTVSLSWRKTTLPPSRILKHSMLK
jgi:hypothetical protein